MSDTTLDPYLMKLVELGMDGADILHGHLKVLMVEAEKQLDLCIEAEEYSEEAMDSMVRTECEGALDTLVALYELTYQLSFAIGIREENRKDGHL